MPKSGKVIIGIVIFLILATSPFWYNLSSGTSNQKPELVIATKDVPGKDKCVRDKDYMRTSHMDLLDEWREDVVRNGNRVYISPDNHKEYNMSLTNTCLDCHSNKEQFCNQCHNYVNVNPYCWTCHIIPEEGK